MFPPRPRSWKWTSRANKQRDGASTLGKLTASQLSTYTRSHTHWSVMNVLNMDANKSVAPDDEEQTQRWNVRTSDHRLTLQIIPT